MNWYRRGEALYAVVAIDDGAVWVVQRFNPIALRLTSTWYFTNADDAHREEAWQRYMDRERYDEARIARIKRREGL